MSRIPVSFVSINFIIEKFFLLLSAAKRKARRALESVFHADSPQLWAENASCPQHHWGHSAEKRCHDHPQWHRTHAESPECQGNLLLLLLLLLFFFFEGIYSQKIKHFKIKSKGIYLFRLFIYFFEGLYSQKNETLKNFKIKSKENKICHGNLPCFLFYFFYYYYFFRDFIHKKFKY